MTYLLAGVAIFMATHVFAASRPRGAGDLKERMGYGPYMGLFSLASLMGLALIIYGFGEARPSPILYSPPVWAKHINLLLMMLAMILLAAAYLPTGRIKKAVKHPMVLSVKVWALGHLLANGELNSVFLFGSFLVYGVVSRIAAKKRGDVGAGAAASVSLAGDALAILIGLAAYAAIAFYLHPILFGVVAAG